MFHGPGHSHREGHIHGHGHSGHGHHVDAHSHGHSHQHYGGSVDHAEGVEETVAHPGGMSMQRLKTGFMATGALGEVKAKLAGFDLPKGGVDYPIMIANGTKL